jgi:phosphoglycolate phosphatase-like HAD superfamily hydrolase
LKKTLLLFDIDGTLLKADDATRRAINTTFSEIFGIENPEQNVPFIGRTDLGIFKDVALKLLGRPLRSGELRQVADRYVTLLPAELELCESFHLMPGVELLLSYLSARTDVILGLETGNIEPAAYLKLKRGGIDRFFSFGGFGSDSEERTELIRIGIERARALNHDNIPEENIFVIGDSPHDISAGKNSGVNTIAVGTGRADKTKLLAECPSCMLPDLSDIPLFMRNIGL